MNGQNRARSEGGGPILFDFIVVGAGPAGCALAARLAQSSRETSVALIEAGPAKASIVSDVPLGIAALVPFKSRHNYAYETVPQNGFNGRKGFQPRGRGCGGSSLINAMVYTRGQPQDYDAWAALGCKGWGWSDVLPYFKRSEDNARGADAFHGAGGPLHVSDLTYRNPAVEAFLAAAVSAGFPRNSDFNGATQEGVGSYQVFQKNGRRYNAARAYLEPQPPNLAIFAGVPARRILFEAVEAANDIQKRVLARKITDRFGASLAGRRFAVWGLAFKPDTDDMREAPSRALIDELLERGASIVAWDPAAGEVARKLYADRPGFSLAGSALEACDGADALVIVTEWKAFRSPDFAEIRRRLREPAIFDGRNLYPREVLERAGFLYEAIGHGQAAARRDRS